MIQIHEICNTHLHPTVLAQLIMVANMADMGAEVTVCVMAPKVTDAPARETPQDYLPLPGVSPQCQIGPLSVHRYVDNTENRRLDRVGGVYFKIRSVTRANGLRPYGWTNLRPEQITGFMLLGMRIPSEEELATRALGEAAQQPQQQNV